MVIVIHQAKSTENAFLYNERKVEQKVASFFHSRNTKSINPFFYNKSHRLKEFTDIEKLNPRVKNKCLHISFNPSTDDYLELTDKTVRLEIDQFMKHMGYGNQPFYVYKHKDLERVHFHIVSSRIDCQTRKKIKDNYECRKTQNFIKELEQRHQLSNKQSHEEPAFKFSARSRNIKQSLEELFHHLNRLENINSKELYDEALKLFNVEVRKSGRGHIVVVTDGKGKVIRYPIRLSKFKESPRFYLKEKPIMEKQRKMSADNELKLDLKKKFLIELMKQIRKKDQENRNRKKQNLKVKKRKGKFKN